MRIVFFIIAFCLLQISEAGAARYALLIGIETYSHGVPALNGPKVDALNIQNLLVRHGGYRQRDISLLINEAATRDNILQQLHMLSQKSNSSDEVVVYYSGHGSQTADFSNDEEDDLDETLVPVDTVKRGGVFYNMITDDEVQSRLQKIQAEKISLIIDSCHSGTITRSLGDIAGELSGIAKTIVLDVQPEFRVQDVFEQRRGEKVFVGNQIRRDISVWTAASSSQLAFTDIETKKGSLFTNRLIAGLGNKKADYNGDSKVSNSELLEYLRNESDLFCQRNKKLCKLGLTPTLETTSDKLAHQVAFLGSEGADKPDNTPLSAYVDTVSIHQNKDKIDVLVSPNSTIKIGEELSLQITSTLNGYLLILDVDSSGRLTQLFPNKYSSIPWERKVQKDTVITFPDDSYGFDFIASEPVGKGRIIIVVIEDKLSFENLLKQNMSLDKVQSGKHYLAELAYGLRTTYRGDRFNRRTRWSVEVTEYNVLK